MTSHEYYFHPYNFGRHLNLTYLHAFWLVYPRVSFVSVSAFYRVNLLSFYFSAKVALARSSDLPLYWQPAHLAPRLGAQLCYSISKPSLWSTYSKCRVFGHDRRLPSHFSISQFGLKVRYLSQVRQPLRT